MPGCPHKAGVTLVELLVSSAVLGISVISLLVVIMSGSVEEQIAEMFAAQPYDAFLAKPFTFAELKDCLVTLVRTA